MNYKLNSMIRQVQATLHSNNICELLLAVMRQFTHSNPLIIKYSLWSLCNLVAGAKRRRGEYRDKKKLDRNKLRRRRGLTLRKENELQLSDLDEDKEDDPSNDGSSHGGRGGDSGGGSGGGSGSEDDGSSVYSLEYDYESDARRRL